MKVALIHNAVLPVPGYGGTERQVWWFAKSLSRRKIDVVLVADPRSQCPYAPVIPFSDEANLRVDADVLHFFSPPLRTPDRPYVVTIGGNGRLGETFEKNTVFVSRNHAERHQAQAFVYPGLDPDDYIFSAQKEPYLVFLAKASWKVKNVKGAIRIAKKAGRDLHIMGGSRLLFNHFGGIHWEGMVGGKRKAEILAKSRGLLFPILWEEPFGLVIVESLVSGTPVLATPRGSMPELLDGQIGRTCQTDEEFLDGIDWLETVKPELCREYALARFHYETMVGDYIKCYERVLRGESLNRTQPIAIR